MEPPKTLGIRHVALKVRDLAKMEGFYAGLGYRVEWRPDPDNVYLALERDSLALHRDPAAAPGGSFDHFGIALAEPDHVDAWAAFLKGRGISLAKEPKTHRDGARSFYVNDPEGNTLQFIYHPPISQAR